MKYLTTLLSLLLISSASAQNIPELDEVPVPKIFPDQVKLTDIEKLGKQLIYDNQLSDPPPYIPRTSRLFKFNIPGEACATCHALATGFQGASSSVNIKFGGVQPGAFHGTFGNRNPPRFGYRAAFTPGGPVTLTQGIEINVGGGTMWDGRFRTMLDLGASVNPNEMGNVPVPSVGNPPLRQGFSPVLADKIPLQPFAPLWLKTFGFKDLNICNATKVGPNAGIPTVVPEFFQPTHDGTPFESDQERIYRHFLYACQAYVSSPEVCSFSSKFDLVQLGKTEFTPEEQAGHDLFFGKAQCSQCHSSNVSTILQPGSVPQTNTLLLVERGRAKLKGRDLFTNYCFVNTGIPSNSNNPQFTINPNFIDPGLAGNTFGGTDGTVFLGNQKYQGQFLVPSLRNIAKKPNEFTKVFMHNGFFESLSDVVHFYNQRNVAVNKHTGLPGIVFDLRDVGALPSGFVPQFPTPENLGNNVYNVEGNSPQNPGTDPILNNGEVGNLGLTPEQERQIVLFLETLTDGFFSY